ncbi:hypothetical protein CTI12_AA454430 [Artemisia annua]|uniref:Uncharacterized protein n=1 Tax=Artemisia annua TaxID=35608 RepID=A0A2U1LU00_ARTAN|nr:hypothetical protein CTI12_AA454430 [Artemisia annua]
MVKMVISVFDKTRSVLQLQVGLLGTAKSLQTDLNEIAKSANTSTSEGFRYILKETILSLLRHPDYCISSYSSVDMMSSDKECEKQFNQLSIIERGKFDKETLVNFNNVKKQCATSHRSNADSNEFIVVTIIVAARGEHELPHIKNGAELKKTLEKLASIPSTNIMATEVLCAPQQENDTYTFRTRIA